MADGGRTAGPMPFATRPHGVVSEVRSQPVAALAGGGHSITILSFLRNSPEDPGELPQV